MSNFGFRRLRVVNPFDVAFREARSAVGASDVLATAEEFKNVAEAVADCPLVIGTTAGRHRQLQQPLRLLNDVGSEIRKRLRSQAVALVFGSEKFGLSTKDMSHCHWLIRIPTHEANVSMNLAQAVAVCLYELVRSTTTQPSRAGLNLVKAGDAERITETLFSTLLTSGYVKPGAGPSAEDKVRRLIRRLNLQAGDAERLLGMLRQIRWKLNQK